MKKRLLVMLAIVVMFSVCINYNGGVMAYPLGIKDIGTGHNYTAVLKEDGTVWVYGQNQSSQLGLGNEIQMVEELTKIPNLVDVDNIFIGSVKSFVQLKDGRVYGWGYNNSHNLLNATVKAVAVPKEIEMLQNVKDMVIDTTNGIVLKHDGSVWMWGNNQFEQLGRPGDNSDELVKINGLNNVVDIVINGYTCMALKDDGTVWIWGKDWSDNSSKSEPIQVSELSDIIQIGICSNAYLALQSDGSLWTWGSNHYGQLGNGSLEDNWTPIKINNIPQIIDIEEGTGHVTAKDIDGYIWTWGSNSAGRLGIGSTVDKVTTPTRIDSLGTVSKIFDFANSATVVLKDDGTYWAFGSGPSIPNKDANDHQREPIQIFADMTQEISAPTNLTASATTSSIELEWDEVLGVDNYIIKRSTTQGGPYTDLATVTSKTTYTDTNVSKDITYYYIVIAVKDDEESEPSNEASAKLKEDVVQSNENAILTITLNNGAIKEYDLTMDEIEDFIEWYTDKADGSGLPFYIFDKDFNLGPFESRKDHIIYNSVSTFEVKEY